MFRRLKLSVNYDSFAALHGIVLKVISGCIICGCFLAVYPASEVGAEVFTNEGNPCIRIETEDEYAFSGIYEQGFEVEMDSTSDGYVVVGSNNEYVFYSANNNPPEGVTGFRETGLYTNDEQNTPVYTIPKAGFGEYAIIKKDGSEVWFITDSDYYRPVLHGTTPFKTDVPLIAQYINGVLNHAVTLDDLRLERSDMLSPNDWYQGWYIQFRFTSDAFWLAAPSGKWRMIDRQTGAVTFPEAELKAEAKHYTVCVIGLIAVCSIVSVFTLYKIRNKGEAKRKRLAEQAVGHMPANSDLSEQPNHGTSPKQ